MNLLSSIFNLDDIEIVKINKKYYLIIGIIFLIIVVILIVKKENYYTNSFTVTDAGVILLVEKEYVDKLKESNEIYIDSIKNGYSINSITAYENNFLIGINLNTELFNISSGNYTVVLGKETLFDYIIKVIKK